MEPYSNYNMKPARSVLSQGDNKRGSVYAIRGLLGDILRTGAGLAVDKFIHHFLKKTAKLADRSGLNILAGTIFTGHRAVVFTTIFPPYRTKETFIFEHAFILMNAAPK
jgi:hypothetical protein